MELQFFKLKEFWKRTAGRVAHRVLFNAIELILKIVKAVNFMFVYFTTI